ncbi:hypothetical protein PDN14_27270 [Bacillus cereus group sp. Bc222]|uniref:hypothetical protein n=1 Tax=Bacillus TaxID=1386 RepID=UPI001868413B|nr:MULTISPECIES: hypothetical protein [Bacillus]MCC2436377.1 hypothetical protein [Bacillus paranthracis]MCU5612081.1 hypothetical protein [Bacillus paranthracis]MDA2013064.1 hypothetical protein [Bacillus cereus group sp. Bcc09]MDA2242077.1 hypothetical protein [Bacillus cereus group sp. Bc222]MDX5829383.1 hypothetical protein [Bacillus cereus group sp. BfR-BA-02147]
MLDKNQSKVVLPSWVWEGVRNVKEAKLKASQYITPERYPGYKIIEIKGDIAVCERESV